jgi:HemY protein
MRRFLLLFAVFLLLGVGLALLFREHNGYLLLAYGPWRLETSLAFALAVSAAAIVLALGTWRLLVTGVLLPKTLHEWRMRRRSRKARQSLYRGLQRLYEGRWSEAETELLRLAEQHESPSLNYLAAARAADHQHAPDRRDRYLEKAAARRGASELAVLLTQAELQMAQGQDAEALASLTRLREIDAEHGHVLALLAELCERLGDWPQLREILEPLRRTGVVDDDRWRELAAAAWVDALEEAGTDADAVTAIWRRAPKPVRRDRRALLAYARRLAAAGAHDRAAERIREALKREWDPDLALAFGELHSEDRTAQLATVESWLKRYGDQPELMLVAGRLCLRNRLWGRARRYFESSLRGANRPEALLELGRLFEEVEQDEDARRAYRQGLELLLGEHPEPD